MQKFMICPDIHPQSLSTGTVRFLPGLRRPGSESTYAPPSGAEVKDGGIKPPCPKRLHVMLFREVEGDFFFAGQPRTLLQLKLRYIH
jgi:hypothetical protein